MSLNSSIYSIQALQTLLLSTHLSPLFKCSKLYVSQLICPLYSNVPNFTSLNSFIYSVQVLQTLRLSTHLSPLFKCSKLYVSQLISLLPSGVPTEIIYLSTPLSPSFLQVSLIPRYFILTSKYTWHTCSRCYTSALHLITIITSICLNLSIKLASLS